MKRWPTKPLGEVAQVTAGDPAPQRAEDFSESGIPFVRMQDVGRYGQTTCLAETKDRLAASASPRFKRFPVGSILVPKSGASIRLNHRAILGVEAHVVSHLAVIVPRESLSSRFAYYWLCATDLTSVAHQADLPSMKTSDLARLELPLPSLPEQERIVKLLDEADELRKLRAQADTRTAQLIPALFHEMFGELNKNPRNWPIKSFTEICESRLGKMLDARKQTGKHNRPYLRNLNVQWGYLNLDKVFEMDFDEREREELRLQYGDVMICEGGAGVGQTAVWRDELPECYFQKSLHRVRPFPNQANSDFIAHLMWALMKENGVLHAVSTATIPHLTGEKLARLRIPVPPLGLQNEFAAHVAEIREMASAQAASRHRLEALFQSLLHRAFNGEL